MKTKTLFGIGVSGSVLAALCCFTPALVLLLGALGLSAWLAWADYVLLPALIVFLAITLYAWQRRRKESYCRTADAGPGR